MISAVDSSVILDIVTADPRHADESEGVPLRASREGQVTACEWRPRRDPSAIRRSGLLRGVPHRLAGGVPAISRQSAILADRHFAAYLQRGGARRRIVADFLIGAHAQTLADRLVARDRGYLRDYFSGLKLLDPSSPG